MKECIIFLTTSSLPPLSPSTSSRPPQHKHTFKHKHINPCIWNNVEDALLRPTANWKLENHCLSKWSHSQREDAGGYISPWAFLEFGGNGRQMGNNEGLSNVVLGLLKRNKQLVYEGSKSNCIDTSGKPVFLRCCKES